MSIGTRIGLALTGSVWPAEFWMLFGYVSPLDHVSIWLAPMAPIVAWFGMETAARLWHRIRLLAYLLVAASQCGAVTWWSWMYGLLAWKHVHLVARAGLPAAVVVVFLAIAVISGRRLIRPATSARTDQVADEVATSSR